VIISTGAESMPSDPEEKFEREANRFVQLRTSLLGDPHYHNRFVAVLDESMVDSDSNEAELVARVYKTYGYRPLYIGKIEVEEEQLDVPSADLA
jgi:hypothetical protein